MLAVQDWAARLAADRDAAVLAARSQAAGIEPLRQQFQALDGTLGFLVNVRNRASAATITEEVARLLPDDAWLGELDIEDQDVRLLGTASHATDLLRVFSGSPLFNSPRFEAPLTQASGSAGDQFDIVMTRN
jgi:general secretion pathway protein L